MTLEFWFWGVGLIELVFLGTFGIIAVIKLRKLSTSASAKYQGKENKNNSCNINGISQMQKGNCQGIMSFLVGICHIVCNKSKSHAEKYDIKDSFPLHSKILHRRNKCVNHNREEPCPIFVKKV
jgi:hypothetical protein